MRVLGLCAAAILAVVAFVALDLTARARREAAAAIIKELRGIKTGEGKRYRTALTDVLDLIGTDWNERAPA